MMKKTNLAKNTILLSIGTLLTKGINLLMIPLFSAWLSTEEYGRFDLFCTYIALLIPFITLSTSDAIFRFSVDEEETIDKSKYITTGLVVSIINFIIVAVTILLIYILFSWKYAIPFIILLFLEIFNNHLQGFARSIKKLNLYSYSSVITTIYIAIFVSLFILKLNLGLYGIIYGYAVGYLFGELFLIVSTNYFKYINLKLYNKKKLKEMIAYSYPLIPNNICWWIVNVSDRTFIKIFLGPSFNGIYAIACKIPNFCASVFNTFSISWQEAAVELATSKERNKYYNKVYNNTTSTIISLCAGLLALNFFMFEYIFDLRYNSAKFYSPILVLSVVFSTLSQYFGGIQISLKKTKENGITTLIGAIVNIIIDLALISYIGLYAAAISTLISNIIICIMRYVRLNKEIQFKITKITYLYIIYFIYLFVMSYFDKILILNIINLILSIIMFCIINIEFEKKIIKKIIKR